MDIRPHTDAPASGLRASHRILHLDRSLTLLTEGERRALANERCAHCYGSGRNRASVCGCVLRAIFRICWSYFVGGSEEVDARRCRRSRSYEYPGLEYAADFRAVAKRALTPGEWRVFEIRYLKGADWRLGTRLLNLDRGKFHHLCYRVQEVIGRACLETAPFALYPPNEYFVPVAGRKVSANVIALPHQKNTEAILRTVAAAA